MSKMATAGKQEFEASTGVTFANKVHKISFNRAGKDYTFVLVDMIAAIRKLPNESWLKRFTMWEALWQGPKPAGLVIYQPIIERILWSEVHGGPGQNKNFNSTTGRMLMVQATLQWKIGSYYYKTTMFCMIEDPDETDYVQMFDNRSLQTLNAKCVQVPEEDKLVKVAFPLYFDAQVNYLDDEGQSKGNPIDLTGK